MVPPSPGWRAHGSRSGTQHAPTDHGWAPYLKDGASSSFAELAGLPKAEWDGVVLRRRLLAAPRIELPDDMGPAGEAGIEEPG
jgi:hypothetical protein